LTRLLAAITVPPGRLWRHAGARRQYPVPVISGQEGMMGFLASLRNLLSDDRFIFNLVAAHGVVLLLVLTYLVLRRLLRRGGRQLAQLTNGHWLDPVSRQVTHHARALLFWCTLGAVLLSTLGGVAYHLIGRDIRRDLRVWWRHWTAEDGLQIGLTLAGLLTLGALTWVCVRLIRRLRPVLERRLKDGIGQHWKEEVLHGWVSLLERFVVFSISLIALWAGGQLIGLGNVVDKVIGFLLRVSAILVIARLLILACPAFSRLAMEIGSAHLNKRPFHYYWERVSRLLPLGERCFEAAVYVWAATLIVWELFFIPTIAERGHELVRCIGIFFGTRVAIELVQVLLNQSFGLYVEDRPVDPKARTLVPLLQSLCQYVLYFGSAILMLRTFGLDVTPILAGVGILGLAVGLGAQSLVTDVVSGFFILFENQYLVGDFVEIGGAAGTVEEVGIRVTEIRDSHGKLHIIPNGQIKNVVNYSKSYVNAVVDIVLPRGTDLEMVFAAMSETGRRLRQLHKEVLGDTEVQGLVDLKPSEMTVRAVTRVHPGSHLRMQNEYRRLLKLVLDNSPTSERASVAA
jgi:small conductance mechanosensitive channel